jgi:hypothetical protein
MLPVAGYVTREEVEKALKRVYKKKPQNEIPE